MVKLSIIVPIYNVEQYLRKCVDSLLAQDMPSSEYEIVLVDDGSTDSCPAICDEYAEKAKSGELRAKSVSICVIHRENGGLSAARNSGIEVAQGEYLMFVDSDDYLQPNVLGALIRQMEDQRLDVLRYNYYNVRLAKSEELRAKSEESRVESQELRAKSGELRVKSQELSAEREYEVFEPHKNAKPYFDYSSEVVDGETFLNERLGYACYAWAFVIKRDLIYKSRATLDAVHLEPEVLDPSDLEDSCLFTEGIYFEDTDWTPRMLVRAKRVASTELKVYNYFWREGSITLPDNPQKKKKVLEDKISLLRGFKEHQKMAQNKQWFVWQTAWTTMSVLGILATYPSAERKPYIKQLKELDIIPLSTFRSNRNGRIKIRIANVSPVLYCWMMNVIHRV